MTIQDIAKLSKVSPATVSRVFNNQSGIGSEIRDRVLEVARLHNYHPRISSKQRNVVIILPYNAIYPVQSCVDMLLMSLTQSLNEHDFRIEILPINSLERLDSIQFCGAVAIGIDPADLTHWDQRFTAPLIILDRDMPIQPPHVYIVRSDEDQGMNLAIEHFTLRGCQKIGSIIHGTEDLGNALMRKNAIIKSLKSHSLPHTENLIYYSGAGNEKYVDLIGKLLRLGVDALFCPGGNAGIMAQYAFSLYGKQIPNDISLITSEQSFFSEHGVPPQTTITQNYTAVANEAVKVIENIIMGNKQPLKTTLPYILIERESVKF